MKYFAGLTTVCLFVIMLVCAPSESVAFQHQNVRGSMLVTTAWLQEHLNDPSLVIVHVGTISREYKDGHIPGARFLWNQWLATSDPDQTLEVPSKVQADSILQKLGITTRSRIVLYFDGPNITPTTRMYFTFDYLGLGDRVALLDGGFDAWKTEGRRVTTEVPVSVRGDFSSSPKDDYVAKCDWLKDSLTSSKVAVVDARAAQFYAGNGGGMPRTGHIPHAVNIPFSSLVDSTNRLKAPASLRTIFQQAGIKPGMRVVSYCHIGQQASLIYFVAKYLGYDAQLYDGSFEEWSGRKDLPVDNPSAQKAAQK